MSRSKKNWNQLVDKTGNYGIDIANGIWPGSGIQSKGDQGPKGETGQKGERGPQGVRGSKGDQGGPGEKGDQGLKGVNAFDVAVEEGFIGTEAEWLETLKGQKGEEGQKGEKGVFDDLTEDEKDRLKGDQGEQGEKGEAAGIFTFQGSEDSLASIEALPGPHVEGDVYKDDSTDDLYVWDGSGFVLLSEALDVVKGQKGEIGEDGADGDKGESGDRGFRGQKGETGLQGERGDDGDSAYEIAVDNGFAGGDEAAWVESLKGDTGDEGQKGEQGSSAYDLSQKGLDPVDVIDEDAWLESLKGDKGENYDPLVLDDYYDKGQVDQLLDQLPGPDGSYDIHEMPPENIADAGETGDFKDEDPYHFLYNPGLVACKAGAVIANSPAAAPFVVRNVVLNNPTKPLRDGDYTVMQEVIAVGAATSTSYIRTAQPGNAAFSPWAESSFDSESYYTKSETDALVNAINYVLSHESAAVKLTDKDGTEQNIQFVGTNGITVTSDPSGIVIDGTDLTPVPQFLGILQDGQDPGTLTPVATDGQYYIIGYTGVTVGTTPDGEACTPGDWVIYKTDSWLFLDISSDPGVVSVSIDGNGLLDLEDSDPANPVIGLDPTKVVTPDELEPYVSQDQLAQVLTQYEMGDLSDVDIQYNRVNFAGSDSRAVYALNLGDGETPSAAGERATDIANKTVLLYIDSSSGSGLTEFYNNIDTSADPKQLIRVTGTGTGIGTGVDRVSTVASKSNDGTVMTIVFDDADVALFTDGCPGEVTFDIVTEMLEQGSILTYDLTSHMWKAGEAADYVKKEGDTMTGELVIDARDSVADEGTLFRLKGVKPDTSAGNLLKAIRKSTGGDQIRYYGPQTSENELATVGFLSDGFLPLTGGTLKGELNMSTLVVEGSDAIGDDGNVLLAKAKDGTTLLRLQNNGKLTVENTLYVDTIEIDSGLGTLASAITGTYSKGLHITFGDEVQLEDHDGNISLCVYGDEVDMGGVVAQRDPALRVTGEGVRFFRALKIGPDAAPPEGRILTSREGNTPPLWKSIESIIAGADLNFVEKPYTVYTADLVSDLTPEAPDGVFHDGELYFSTITNELFVYGNGNWWPTSVDWQADIVRLQEDVAGKLNLTGGTLSGKLKLEVEGTEDDHAVTKKYVDDNSGGVEVLAGNKSNAQVGDMWFNTSANVMYLRVD